MNVTAHDVYVAQVKLAKAEADLREEKLMLARAETAAEYTALGTDASGAALGTNDTIRKIRLAEAVMSNASVTNIQASVLVKQHAVALAQAEYDLVKGERRDQDAVRQESYIAALEAHALIPA
jgi:hypothetical protein